MSGIALLVPREEMLRQAQTVLAEGEYTVNQIRCIKTEDAVKAAQEFIQAGASVIIARGLQASIIRQHCNLPMVLIRITAGKTDRRHRPPAHRGCGYEKYALRHDQFQCHLWHRSESILL